MWLLYLPVAAYAAYLSIRFGGPTTITCANPGIPGGGGFVGESKFDIYRRLGASDRLLHAEYLPPGEPAARAAELRRLVETTPRLGGFPLILKPDAGQRGFGVKLVHNADEARRYFESMRAPAVAQRYHPGPYECGIVWSRRPGDGGGALNGFLYSITRKEFPFITGDGAASLAGLIAAHPRYRLQRAVFLARLGEGAGRVPARGERVRLAIAGNHCQGTLFRDGMDLASPELERRVDEIASGFEGGLDYARFDIRYESDEALRRGEFGIVELNGTLGEPTAMYDPEKGVRWAYALLLGQWKLLYRHGARRRAAGVAPTGVMDLLRAWRLHRAARSGNSISD